MSLVVTAVNASPEDIGSRSGLPAAGTNVLDTCGNQDGEFVFVTVAVGGRTRGRVVASGGDALHSVAHSFIDPIRMIAGTGVDPRVLLSGATVAPGDDTDVGISEGSIPVFGALHHGTA